MAKKNLTIGLIIPSYKEMFNTFYTMEMIKGVSERTITLGLELITHTTKKHPLKDPFSDYIFNHSFVDGLLFADRFKNEENIDMAKKRRIPYLILNYFDKRSKENCIGIDNENAAVEVVKYLFSLGHKIIVKVTGKLDAQAGIQRLYGFKKGMKECGLKIEDRYIIRGDWTKESGRKAIDKILRLKPLPTAVFFSGDEMAISALERLKEKGFKTPEDLSIVGFDDIPESSFSIYSLTTVRQPLEELSIKGVEILKDIIEGKRKEPVKLILTGTEIIKRNSVRSFHEG